MHTSRGLPQGHPARGCAHALSCCCFCSCRCPASFSSPATHTHTHTHTQVHPIHTRSARLHSHMYAHTDAHMHTPGILQRYLPPSSSHVPLCGVDMLHARVCSCSGGHHPAQLPAAHGRGALLRPNGGQARAPSFADGHAPADAAHEPAARCGLKVSAAAGGCEVGGWVCPESCVHAQRAVVCM